MPVQLKALGAKVVELDFTDEQSINQAAKDFGDQPLDILINCAGELAMSILVVSESLQVYIIFGMTSPSPISQLMTCWITSE
jgi:NAD(P)-dependent dehydrogenase (short-subunit alcohol dehydrogenase family)